LKRPRRFLLAEEVRRLVAASKEPTLTIILPATTTGFRIGEILALRWGRIPRWRRRWRSLRMLAQRTTFLHAPPNSSPLAFLASHLLRFSQRASLYRYIRTSFRTLAALLPLEIAAGHRQFPGVPIKTAVRIHSFVKISQQDQTFSCVLSSLQ